MSIYTNKWFNLSEFWNFTISHLNSCGKMHMIVCWKQKNCTLFFAHQIHQQFTSKFFSKFLKASFICRWVFLNITVKLSLNLNQKLYINQGTVFKSIKLTLYLLNSTRIIFQERILCTFESKSLFICKIKVVLARMGTFSVWLYYCN